MLSREDWTASGERRIDPVLGADPIGILAYAKNKFTAQFMKRDRTIDSANEIFTAGQNNTVAMVTETGGVLLGDDVTISANTEFVKQVKVEKQAA